MRVVKYILFGVLVAGLSVGCTPGGTTSTDVVTYQGIDPMGGSDNAYQVSANDTGHFVQIFSQQSWSIELTFPNPADANWCTLSKTSGMGSDKSRLTYSQNTGASRMAVITVYFDKGERSITVTQLSTGGTTPALGEWLEMPEVSATRPSNLWVVTHFVPDRLGVRNYTVMYDVNQMYPLWVAYPMHKVYTSGSTGRTDLWAYDPNVPTEYQPNMLTGMSNGYDRGHMLASAHRYITELANNQTFYFTNMTAQKNILNGFVWANLESYERAWQGTGQDTLYCVTGAALQRVDITDSPNPKVNCRGKMIPVPKYYYKAMLKVTHSGSTVKYKAIAWWYLHLDPTLTKERTVLPTDAITVRELEQRTGINFFSNLPQNIQDQIENVEYKAADWAL